MTFEQIVIKIIESGADIYSLATIGGTLLIITLLIFFIRDFNKLFFTELFVAPIVGMVGMKICYTLYIELAEYSWNWIVCLLMIIGFVMVLISIYLQQIEKTSHKDDNTQQKEVKK